MALIQDWGWSRCLDLETIRTNELKRCQEKQQEISKRSQLSDQRGLPLLKTSYTLSEISWNLCRNPENWSKS